jgi:hypothetical protein
VLSRHAVSCRHQDYKPQYWYWDVAEMVKKVCLACIALFFDSGTTPRIVFAFMVTTALAVQSLRLQPYRFESQNRAYQLGQWSLWLTLFYGLLTMTSVRQTGRDDSSMSASAFGGVLATLPFVVIAVSQFAHVGDIVSVFWQRYVDKHVSAVALAVSLRQLHAVSTLRQLWLLARRRPRDLLQFQPGRLRVLVSGDGGAGGGDTCDGDDDWAAPPAATHTLRWYACCCCCLQRRAPTTAQSFTGSARSRRAVGGPVAAAVESSHDAMDGVSDDGGVDCDASGGVDGDASGGVDGDADISDSLNPRRLQRMPSHRSSASGVRLPEPSAAAVAPLSGRETSGTTAARWSWRTRTSSDAAPRQSVRAVVRGGSGGDVDRGDGGVDGGDPSTAVQYVRNPIVFQQQRPRGVGDAAMPNLIVSE